MSSFVLKLLAMVSMAIDHTGALLFPGNEVLRLIGRIAFPIYCFLLAEGFVYTSSRRRYLIRMAVWGVISEPVFDFAFYRTWWEPAHQNVFFTLFLGLTALWLLEHFFSKNPVLGMSLVLLPFLAAELLSTDYGGFGVILIVLFYACRCRRAAGLSAFALLNTGFSLTSSWIQLAGAFAVIPLAFYNGKRGPKLPGWIFYAFYPAHLLLLWWLQWQFF